MNATRTIALAILSVLCSLGFAGVLRAKDGSFKRAVNVDAVPGAPLFDGSSMWIACEGSDVIDKITLR